MKIERKNPVDEINLAIRGIRTGQTRTRRHEMISNVITIQWDSDIGFGEYELHFHPDGKIIGSSETMDSGDDKDFLRKLFSLIADKAEVNH